jgi:hypothetical protein
MFPSKGYLSGRCKESRDILTYVFIDINYWLTPSAFFYPAPKSTKDKNPQAMPRVGTGTCDGKSGEKSEPIFFVYQLLQLQLQLSTIIISK